jgi:hypothetical protein
MSLHGIIQVVLSAPINNLHDYKGKELRFDVLGHDLLGRPIVDPYLGNTRIEDWSEPLPVDNELSNINSWREVYEKDEAALRPSIQDISSSRT